LAAAAVEGGIGGDVQRDALAVLAAALAFDGARQRVLYTHDVSTRGEGIKLMPRNAEPYPIELSTHHDLAAMNVNRT
jgi:hypothetical protein